MKEFNKDVNLISYTIDNVKEKDLNEKIYAKCMEDLEGYIKVDTFSSDYKVNLLDLFAKDSYVVENQKDWMNYKGLDNVPSYQRNNNNIVVDIMADPNNIPIKEKEFDIIFTVGNKSFFGMNHQSLFEVERILKQGGFLIASLSKYLYYKEINQLLVCYRNFDYVRAIEINYNIIETKVESAKYFCYYRFKG